MAGKWLPDDYTRNNRLILARIESDLANERPMRYLFLGCCGCGKTHLARALYNETLRRLKTQFNPSFIPDGERNPARKAVKTAKWMRAGALYDVHLHRLADHDTEPKMLLCRPVCVLDDLGDEPDTQAAHEMLSSVLRYGYEYEDHRLLIITTNLKSADIERLYGERVLDRFDEMITVMKFEDTSFRSKKSEVISEFV